jgi:hypothetical protein
VQLKRLENIKSKASYYQWKSFYRMMKPVGLAGNPGRKGATCQQNCEILGIFPLSLDPLFSPAFVSRRALKTLFQPLQNGEGRNESLIPKDPR